MKYGTNHKRGILLPLLIVFVLLFTSCNNTSYKESNNVVEPTEVKEAMNNSDVIVIDARSQEDYAKGHLEGAINLNPSSLTISEPVKGLIAGKEQVEKILSEKGISNDSTIFIYDNNKVVYSSRLWWVLKVYGHDAVKVINNGQKGLETAKFPMSLEVPQVEPAEYVAKEANNEMIATMEDVKTIVENEDSKEKIIDVRSKAEYEEGAIPGAILYPHTKNLYTDGTFKSARDTFLFYKDLGLDKDDAIILYCKSSFRATQTALLLDEAGFSNVKVYDGAWLEWSAGDMPTEKEEKTMPDSGDAS
jgi:thiosulfate/3-mercaptopyruvate sulfurtransferase